MPSLNKGLLNWLNLWNNSKKPIVNCLMEIRRDFQFEAAHHLPHVPENHKCRRLHGHSYKVSVWIKGEPDQHMGWVMDFGEIKEKVSPIIEQLDHRYLNDIEGLENPTSELLCMWLYRAIAKVLPQLHAVEIHETCQTSCLYKGL